MKPLLETLTGNKQDRPPFWFMRQAGRYLPEYRSTRERAGSFLDLCLDPELATEVTLQPIRRFGMDGAILFADILIVPYALGQSLAYVEGSGPKLEPIRSVDELRSVDHDAFGALSRRIAETVQGVKAEAPQETTVIGFAGAPWTVATYMIEGQTSRDFAQSRTFAYSDPDAFSAILDRLVQATIQYLSDQIEAGADTVQLFDSWAGILPAPAFRSYVIDPTRRIVVALKARYPDVPIIGFPRGAGIMYEEYLRETKVDAVGVDTTLPAEWMRDTMQPQAPVQGNLDPILLAVGGAPMLGAAIDLLRTLEGGPYIFNLGHGILPHTPVEHVEILSTLIREWPTHRLRYGLEA